MIRLLTARRIACAILFAVCADAGMALVHRAGDAAATEARVADPVQLWTCGMHPQVLQDHPGPCPICGMQLTPVKRKDTAAPGAARVIRYWWDPMMSPPYISDKPGKSPMGMDLVPVYADEVSGGTSVVVDPVIVQNMGVRVATVVTGPLRTTVRAVGYLDEAQPNQHDINLRVSGWIEQLYASIEGMHLDVGHPLFELYSPELQVAIEELIGARRMRSPSDTTGATLYDAAARKLQLLGLPPDQIERLGRAERAPATVTFSSPVSGHLVEKMVVDGSAVKAGDRVMRIVDHSTLWLDARVFEQQLPFITIGQRAVATVAAEPGRHFDGTVMFVHPHVDMTTRTALVRIALPNEALTLRPGMYATVEIEAELAADALLVPREAVIDTGTRQIAFVALDGGHFEPRTLKLGAAGNGSLQVLAGLAPGDRVVTSGQFLLDAESHLQEAIEKHMRDKLLIGGNAAAAPAADPTSPSPAPPTDERRDDHRNH